MTQNVARTQLEEFEMLLDDDFNTPNVPSIQKQFLLPKFDSPLQKKKMPLSNIMPRMPLKPSRAEKKAPEKGVMNKLFEIRRPSYSGYLTSLINLKDQRDPIVIRKKKAQTQKLDPEDIVRTKKAVPTILISQSNPEKEKDLPKIRASPVLEDLKNSNRNLQKESYNELLQLFRDSTSTNPIRAFNQTPNGRLGTEPSQRRKSEYEIKDMTKETVGSRGDLKDILQQEKEEEAIRAARKTVEMLVQAIQIDPSQSFSQSLRFESQNIELNDWKAITMNSNLTKIEIFVIDMVNFGIQAKSDVVLKTEFSQDIGTIINSMINQISGMANEGKHLLVYFHNRQGQIKLFLSKFYFIVKNNHQYTVGLKNEKEIILYYMLMLGILEFKLKYDDKPISEEKLNAVKNKAANLVRGDDPSVNPFLCEWLNLHVRQQISVEKLYLNPTRKGKSDANFMFNLSEYLKSINSPFYISQIEEFIRKNRSATQSPSLTSLTMLDFTKNLSRTVKSRTSPPIDPLGLAEHMGPSVNSKRNMLVPNPNAVPFDTVHASSFKPSTTPNGSPRNPNLLQSLNVSPQAYSFRNPVSSLDYLSPRESPQAFNKSKGKKKKKILHLSNEVEFVELDILKPKSSFNKLNAYLEGSTLASSVRSRSGFNKTPLSVFFK